MGSVRNQREQCFYISFNPSPIATPRNATGYGRGGGEYPIKLRRDKTVQSDTFNPLPLLIADEIGERIENRGVKKTSISKINDLSTPLLRNYRSFGLSPIFPYGNTGEKVELLLCFIAFL